MYDAQGYCHNFRPLITAGQCTPRIIRRHPSLFNAIPARCKGGWNVSNAREMVRCVCCVYWPCVMYLLIA